MYPQTTDQLRQEAFYMSEYALANGLTVSPDLVRQVHELMEYQQLKPDEVGRLADCHQRLARIIAPATPQSVALIRAQKRKPTWLQIMGSVPLTRHLIFMAIFLMLTMVSVGQLAVINTTNINLGILGNHGWVAVAIVVYLVCFAGLGACFSALYKANRYISAATYDPRYDSTYWAAIILGIIAGVFMSELLADVLFKLDANSQSGLNAMGKPLLAVLGGFSANMVYHVLQRLVDTIEGLFKGDQQTIQDGQKALALKEGRQLVKEEKMALAGQLVNLEKDILNDPSVAADKLRNTIDALVNR